jgi:hypothetical protein
MEIKIELTVEEEEFLKDLKNLPNNYPKIEVKSSFRDTDRDMFSKAEDSMGTIAKIDMGSVIDIPLRALVVCGCCKQCRERSLMYSKILSKLIAAFFLGDSKQ